MRLVGGRLMLKSLILVNRRRDLFERNLRFDTSEFIYLGEMPFTRPVTSAGRCREKLGGRFEVFNPVCGRSAFRRKWSVNSGRDRRVLYDLRFDPLVGALQAIFE